PMPRTGSIYAIDPVAVLPVARFIHWIMFHAGERRSALRWIEGATSSCTSRILVRTLYEPWPAVASRSPGAFRVDARLSFFLMPPFAPSLCSQLHDNRIPCAGRICVETLLQLSPQISWRSV